MIRYQVFSPGGNTTALINQSLILSDKSEIASEIMKADRTIEQVGFVMPTTDKDHDFELEMMGGEFCVNAARSAVLLYFKQTGQDKVSFKVSGFSSTIIGETDGDNVALSLPNAIFINSIKITQGWLVDLQGIRFIVSENPGLLDNPQEVIGKYDTHQIPAIGLVHFSKIDSNQFKINPWVWVKKTATLINESACGSGSLAVHSVINQKSSIIIQPSGSSYNITSENDKNRIILSGKVSYLFEKLLERSA